MGLCVICSPFVETQHVFSAFCGREGYIMETDKSDERDNETERNGKGKKELVESTCRMSVSFLP
jgi:hypothetical protein